MKFRNILTAVLQRPADNKLVADTNMKVENALPRLFDWVEIPAGKVTLVEGNYLEESTTFDVPAFTIAKYPVTNMQFSYFVASGGYHQQRWWTEAGWQECKQHNWTWPRY